MMNKTLLTGSFALLACISVAAQAPAPAPSTQAPAPTAAAKANSLIVEGCLQRSPQAATATPGATGTAGAASETFTLANAMKPASAPAGATIASSYRLDAEASKLTPHVGHKVEITGTLEAAAAAPSGSASSAPASGASAAAPRLKVDNVKMLAATCTAP
jgi:pyruvate/2-oxoglutarate dehydrogenase complex dihydrolipoamide acyltransferase (E2) component